MTAAVGICARCEKEMSSTPPGPHSLIVRNRRESLGLTREQLAEKVDGLSVRTLLRIEVHGVLPRARTLANIARVLDLTVDQILAEPAAAAS